MGENHKSLLGLVNASGFLFQLRVEREIKRTKRDHEWQFVGREHRWIDTESGAEGFIDLVFQSGNLRMVIECKRVRDASWVFLLWDKDKRRVNEARLLWTERQARSIETSPYKVTAGWKDYPIKPLSVESPFCVIRQSPQHMPMLERLSGIVLKSVEGLAEEELQLRQSVKLEPSRSELRIYIPVIITTAKLHACVFDLNKVDLRNGQLQLTDSEFESVPFIRFRKGLTATRFNKGESSPISLWEANRQTERTLFIVHATEIVNFLSHLDYFR